MKRFFKIQRKKSPQPPPQSIPPGNSADVIAVLPEPGFHTGLGLILEGGQSRYQASCNPTVKQGERGGVSPQIALLGKIDEDKEHPASGASTSGVVIGITDRRDKPTGECS